MCVCAHRTGEYMVKELEAYVFLHRYRSLKRSYGEHQEDR